MDQNDYVLKQAENDVEACHLCALRDGKCSDIIEEDGGEWVIGCFDGDAVGYWERKHTLQQAPDHVDPCTLCDILNDAGMCKDPDSMGRECGGAGYWSAS